MADFDFGGDIEVIGGEKCMFQLFTAVRDSYKYSESSALKEQGRLYGGFWLGNLALMAGVHVNDIRTGETDGLRQNFSACVSLQDDFPEELPDGRFHFYLKTFSAGCPCSGTVGMILGRLADYPFKMRYLEGSFTDAFGWHVSDYAFGEYVGVNTEDSPFALCDVTNRFILKDEERLLSFFMREFGDHGVVLENYREVYEASPYRICEAYECPAEMLITLHDAEGGAL